MVAESVLTLFQFLIFTMISLEFGFYVLIRQLVNTKEWLTAWGGKKGALRKRLRAAETYQVLVPYISCPERASHFLGRNGKTWPQS
jgi:hypothetical protein